MASEEIIQFRRVSIVEGTSAVSNRLQYRTRKVQTGLISLAPALTGVDAWGPWTNVPYDDTAPEVRS